MINASSARTGDLNMLSTANIQTFFERSKKKKLFCFKSKDICGFICICEQLSFILLSYNHNTHSYEDNIIFLNSPFYYFLYTFE